MRARKKGQQFKIVFFIFLFISAFVGLGAWALTDFFSTSPLNALTTMASGQDLEQTDGHVNILVLGLDRRILLTSAEHGVLTDSIMLVSVDVQTGKAVVLSLPRDMWVPYPDGGSGKINALYATGMNRGESGAEYAAKALENVLGIPIHYYLVVGFDSFVRAVDILGGIEVDVERAFDDYMYPIPGRENVLPEEDRYEHLHFEAGRQHMDGETALKFARSRKALGEEGSDFSRAKRQQKIVMAVKDKFLSLDTLARPARVKNLFAEFRDSVETNVVLAEAQEFLLLLHKIDGVTYSVINGSGPEDSSWLLKDVMDEDSYGGAYVLVPVAGDYSQIQAFVRELMFSSD